MVPFFFRARGKKGTITLTWAQDPRGTGRSPRVSARIRANPRRKFFRRASSPKQDMIQTTTTHFANGNVYKKLTMPQGDDETQKFIQKLTNTLETLSLIHI